VIELEADLWSVEADAVVITTNGTVKANGEAVMGRGCAREAVERFPWLPKELGLRLGDAGNHVFVWRPEEHDVGFYIVTFPVKHLWRDGADRRLISQSMDELLRFVWAHEDVKRVVMPRPGCGNGGLSWDGPDGVARILRPHLDERFTVVTQPEVQF
jgi:hypothetical protein